MNAFLLKIARHPLISLEEKYFILTKSEINFNFNLFGNKKGFYGKLEEEVPKEMLNSSRLGVGLSLNFQNQAELEHRPFKPEPSSSLNLSMIFDPQLSKQIFRPTAYRWAQA